MGLLARLIGSETGRELIREAVVRAGFRIEEGAEVTTDSGYVDLTCVVLDHPDQFAAEDVQRLLGGSGSGRILCVRSAWCASLLRTRDAWPVGVMVGLERFAERLAIEVEILQGARPAIPMTAGLEEVSAAGHAPVVNATGRGRTAAVVSVDAELRRAVIDQLAEAQFTIVDGENEAVDLMVIDVDGRPTEELAASSRAGTTVRLSSWPQAGTGVASKFQPVAEWLRRLGFVALLLTAAMPGCRGGSTESPGAVAQSSGWAEQVAAVKRGEKKSINVSGRVASSEWQALGSGCGGLEVLELDNPELTPGDVEMVLGLANLKRLKLGRGVTDESAAAIGRHPKIAELLISSDELTDAGMKSLCQLPLEQLWLQAPKVSDAGVAEIGKLQSLRFLHLLDVPMTDAALPAFAGLKKLESLYLDRAKCTEEGLSGLLKEMPEIHFHRDQTHLRDDPRRDGH